MLSDYSEDGKGQIHGLAFVGNCAVGRLCNFTISRSVRDGVHYFPL